MTDYLKPCDRTFCFHAAEWIVLNMPRLSEADKNALGLTECLALLESPSASPDALVAALRKLVPAMGRQGSFVQIRCQKHLTPDKKTADSHPLRLPIPLKVYVDLFGFPRLG